MGPKRRTPRNFCKKETNITYWDALKRRSVYKYTSSRKERNDEILKQRRLKRINERDAFAGKYRFKRKRGRGTHHNEIIKCLTHWVKFLSWGFCNSCGLLDSTSLCPKSFNSKGAKHVVNCVCSKKKYVVPTFSAIPTVLIGLTPEEESILSIFNIDIGQKKIARAGHRIKNGAFELRYRPDTVEDRIESISSSRSKRKVKAAYEYLKSASSSAYSDYLSLQTPSSPDISKIKFWKVYKNMPAVECALWPVLYPFTSWCESIIDGKKHRNSTLASFRSKLLCNILDYNNSFELLQYQYDRWLFKTITGAVTVGKSFKTSPARALETKSFSSEYWRWQHRYLQDAVLQFGSPSLFLTISPYEWDFPKPEWVSRALIEQDIIPTESGAIETLPIAHTLEQICKGYLCGTNTSEWETHSDHHVFHDIKSTPGNVRCVFFRFEYQQRRTIHVHMLVWLRNLCNINLNLLSATIPDDDEELAFLVDRIQPSDKPSPFLSVFNEKNEISENTIRLKHTEKDAELNLRAYVPTVIGTLNSRMDVQASDGKAALLKYASSYVTKLQEPHDALRSTETTPFQVAIPFLIDDKPGEPEMVMAFSKTKMSNCNLSRFKLVPPVSETYFSKSSVFKKYTSRPNSEESLSCLDYCRQYLVSKRVPTLSNVQNLVGVKYKYIFSQQFFFQYSIVNTPFRKLKDLQHPLFESVQENLKGFSYMIQNHSDFLQDKTLLTNFLCNLSYKKHVIESFISFKDGLCFLFYKTLNSQNDILQDNQDTVELNSEQMAVYLHVTNRIQERSFAHNYSSDSDLSLNSESEDDSDSDSSETSSRSVHINIDLDDKEETKNFVRPTLLAGKPGTGKTKVISEIVKNCLTKGLKVLFASPTAHQARQLADVFGDDENVRSDTIHSLFKIPISPSDQYFINWALMLYDLIVVDEVAMVDIEIVEHIFNTCKILPSAPYLFLAGDRKQQQPLKTINGQTRTGVNIFSSNHCRTKCDLFTLHKSIRCQCGILDSILSTIRNYHPTPKQLDIFNDSAFSKSGENVSSTIVENAFATSPNATFLTISKEGCYFVNDTIVKFLFSSEKPLISSARIADNYISDIFKGMRVMLTRNLSKHLNIVNGESGVVDSYDRKNIIVQLSNGTFVPIYEIKCDDNDETYFPLLPNYALTIFKAQGKTLNNVVIWFDKNISSPGAGYVAISRVRCHKNIRLLQEATSQHFAPIDGRNANSN